MVPGAGAAHITAEGWFPHGGLPILMTMVAVNFAFSGTELIGIAAVNGKSAQSHSGGHSHHHRPADYLFYRHRLRAGGADPDAAGGGGKSPFVLVFEKVGIPTRRIFLTL
jgi:S-methylmethionine transporter